jgi:L-fuconolactonase
LDDGGGRGLPRVERARRNTNPGAVIARSLQMPIDTHQHFWRYRAEEYPWITDPLGALRRDFLPADLEPRLRQAGFDRCIAVQARSSVRETEWLLDLAETHPFIAGVVGWVDLCRDDVDTDLAALACRPQLVGIRHVVQDEPDDRFLLRPDFCRGIARLEGFGLVYDLLIFPRHLPVAIEFAARFPAQPFVLDHLGKPEIRSRRLDSWVRDLRRLARFPHVCAKISGLVTEADWKTWQPGDLDRYIQSAYDCFGPERLMVGSDWPVCTLAAGYEQTMGVVSDFVARLPAAEREAILDGNAERVYLGRSRAQRNVAPEKAPN